ncbi:MAG: homocysteine S-methyltransferase family protein [Pseudomonadota bacterium]
MIGARSLIFDGAMGTMLHDMGISVSCNEEANLTSPGVISDIHRQYLDAGADIITTNTFGASRVTLADHGLSDRIADINRAAVTIARAAADKASTSARPRLVAGEMGPTSKLPTLGHISFAELFAAYEEQAVALIHGGSDLIILSTCQDPLQAKAAAAAALSASGRTGRRIPLIVSVTIEKSGTMLLGTEITAALASIAPYRPNAFGVNCSTGPEAMEEYLHELVLASSIPIICRPNAGMPENVDGRPRYPLEAEGFARALGDLAGRFGLAIVGGCCGTTPAHIAALAKAVTRDSKIGTRKSKKTGPMVSSIYTATALDQEPRPFIVAEQANVNGSKAFKELLLKSDYDAMAEVGRRAAGSCHAIDVCVAYAGRDERKDMAELVRRLVVKVSASLMIDSTNPDAIEDALSLIPGRAIINSINLEDGGEKAKRIIAIARRFGAAVVALVIDENGMAREPGAKLDVARRIVDMALAEGLDASDLLIDPLTFTLASGDANLRKAGLKTLEGLRLIKSHIKGVRTILGVSNISFGLPLKGRKVLTSVFLNRAVEAGLDAAIINPSRIMPLHRIPKEEAKLCERLINNDTTRGDPLMDLIKHTKQKSAEDFAAPDISKASRTPENLLKKRILDGSSEGFSAILDNLLERMSPADIINRILMPAMQEVGRRFGEACLPLPFVLASAEAMRTATDILAPHMAAGEDAGKGTIVLATVREDVHDIGKNLVDAILSNNGFRVVNLGIRQTAAAIMEAVRKHGADAIGLSGLLVKSTEVMREDLEIFRENGLGLPVLCGGAALTRSFAEKTLSKAYGGRIYYCSDAFAGLMAMEEIVKSRI